MRLPILPAAFVISIAGDQRHRDRRFRVNHLLGPLINFAPRICFLERGTTERAVAHIRHRDLHGIFVHSNVETEVIAGHHRVLGKILRNPAADHE